MKWKIKSIMKNTVYFPEREDSLEGYSLTGQQITVQETTLKLWDGNEKQSKSGSYTEHFGSLSSQGNAV